jgi:tripartite-type tricarboxylate transporter receptor subunit TctC
VINAKLARAGLFAVASLCILSATAQSYPLRPIRLITPQTAGASMDVLVRIIAPRWAERLGQPMVVDNRGGAGGIIGTETGARAAPDGYTLTVGAPSTMITARFTQRSLPYDPLRDFSPLSLIVNAEAVMVVYPGLSARTVQEFIALAKAQPGKLNMASAGVGSSSHLAGVLFTTLAGIDTVHVPYKGGGPVAASLISGESQWTIVPAGAVVTHVRAGRLRALAVSTAKRSPVLPELPTLQEAGVRGYEYNAWNGVFAPHATPRNVVDVTHAALQKVLADADVKRQFANQGLQPLGSATPEEFGAFVRADYERIARVVKVAGIKPE